MQQGEKPPIERHCRSRHRLLESVAYVKDRQLIRWRLALTQGNKYLLVGMSRQSQIAAKERQAREIRVIGI
jgi:hypothetical protein